MVAKLEILGVSAFPWNVASNPNNYYSEKREKRKTE